MRNNENTQPADATRRFEAMQIRIQRGEPAMVAFRWAQESSGVEIEEYLADAKAAVFQPSAREECSLCSGTGEIPTQFADGPTAVGCPECIERTSIAKILELTGDFNRAYTERARLLEHVDQIERELKDLLARLGRLHEITEQIIRG